MMDLKVPRFNAISKKSKASSANNKNSTPTSSSSFKSKGLILKSNGRTAIEKSKKVVSGNKESRSSKSKNSKKLNDRTCYEKRITTTVENSSQKVFQEEDNNLRTKKNLIPNITPKTFYRNINVGESSTIRKKPTAKELDKSDKLIGQEASSKSMRQLFSIADSWSSDSVISHSDSCTCCHNEESSPVRETNGGIADKG
ncbi:uncharacterized protein LOC124946837 [Vespa velutina]|uniref:uncharacterized protein LOC124946837 n=1 Tax=Vespa velutina TaxID=202808 RepID=UPI001FB3061D|nr:uncharacterized protein LOC124946837 [Vespa velutina]